MRAQTIAWTFLVACAWARPVAARVWFVAPDSAVRGDGSSWSSPLREPAAALANARAGDELWLKAGTYHIEGPLTLREGISVLGGFAGTERASTERDSINFKHETILRQVRRGSGVMEIVHGRNVRLDGLTLTGAQDHVGLRLEDCDASVRIANCRIAGNQATEPGAGMRVAEHSAPQVTNCQLADNRSAAEGGGLFIDATSGGAWSWCIINGNTAEAGAGGGASIENGARPLFTHCDFYFNASPGSGSALACGTGFELRDCTFASNLASGDGAPGFPLRVRGSGGGPKLVLSGETYVIGNLRRKAAPSFASGIDGEEFCELRDHAVISKKETGPADLALFTRRNDVHVVMYDVFAPPLTAGPPAPGQWVKDVLPARRGTAAYHCIYLPSDWQPGRTYPLLVGFPGNGPFRNPFGDRSGGMPEDNPMGIGVTGGRGAIVLGLGYLDSRKNLAPTGYWWGDVAATIAYTEEVVRHVCVTYGADSTRVVLYGFSRSAIGCSFIGLHDDTIAPLWRAFLCYDGWESQADMTRDWYRYGQSSFNYDPKDFDGTGVARRFARLAGRPLFILGGRGAVEELNATRHFPVELLAKPHRNHNVTWSLRETPERAAVRAWLERVLQP